jgi:hypothetical protein
LLTVCTPSVIKFLKTLVPSEYTDEPEGDSKLKLIAFASDKAPVVIVFVGPTVERQVHSTNGVPLTVNPVTVDVVQIVVVLVAVNTILPVPKLSVLVLLLLLEKITTVNVNVLNARVPAVSVKPNVFDNVNESPNVIVPPVALIVIGLAIVTPLVVTVLVLEPASVTAPVMVQTVPAIYEMLPLICSVGVVPLENVTVPALTVKDKHASAPVIGTEKVPA